MFKGIVKWFSVQRGFGMIEHHGGTDVFVHNTAVRDGGSNILVQGEKVQFDVVYGPGGPKSKNVRRGDSGERIPFSGGPE